MHIKLYIMWPCFSLSSKMFLSFIYVVCLIIYSFLWWSNTPLYSYVTFVYPFISEWNCWRLVLALFSCFRNWQTISDSGCAALDF